MSSQEIIETYITKWYVVVPTAFVIYKILGFFYGRYLMNKLGAKPFLQSQSDGYIGFKVPFELMQKKTDGTLIDFTYQRVGQLDHPEIPTFKFPVFSVEIVSTLEPENIKAILATQFNDFSLGTRHAHFAPLLGDGIFTLDGAGWKHSRSMLRPQFAREQVSHVKLLEPHMQVFFKHVRKNQGKAFDIQELFFRLTVDSATEFLFGESAESLRDDSVGLTPTTKEFEGRKDFADAFNYAQTYQAYRFLLQQLYWILNGSEFRKSISTVHKFADYYVQKALDLTPEQLEKQDGYVFLYELAKQTRDPKVLRDQLLNILVAGRDTTAGLLSFLFFELSRNPEIFAKLREEIENKFGLGEDARVEEISFETLKSCEYLKAVINETLRIYPSVPHNFRVATRNTTLPRGGGSDGLSPIAIRKGQVVMYTILATHRDKDIYGADADVFRPERWFEPETRKLGWAYVPFNGGPRICLGQQFALTEASYVTVRLLQEFGNLKQDPNTEYPPKLQNTLTMSLYDGAEVQMF